MPSPKITAEQAVLIRLLKFYSISGYRTSHLEMQELAYFLKVAGEPALQKLEYQRFRYGPYAHNLGHAMQRMEGHYVREYGDGSEGPAGPIADQRAQIQVLPEGQRAAQAFFANDPDADQYLNRVQNLIEGFETPYGMEMLATLHWVAQEDPAAAADCDVAIQRVYSKPQIGPFRQ